ncbi:MAG: hypothetical protein ABII96_08300, partial [Candidatus Zixiibacteriota bacterium]
ENIILFHNMNSSAAAEIVNDVESEFGGDGQAICQEALIKVSSEFVKKCLENFEMSEDVNAVDAISIVFRMANEAFWGCIVEPLVGSGQNRAFEVQFCPVQEIFEARDCRMHRYWLQGFIEGVKEKLPVRGFNLAIDRVIPEGADACRFAIRKRQGKKVNPLENDIDTGGNEALDSTEENEHSKRSGTIKGKAPEAPPKMERIEKLRLNIPYAKSKERLRRVARTTEESPIANILISAQLMANTVLEIFERVESRYDAAGQKICAQAIVKVGYDLGKQVLEGGKLPDNVTPIEKMMLYVSWLNYYPYASPEIVQIIDDYNYFLEVLWCPVQDIFKPIDCRIMRYLMEGHLKAASEHGLEGYDMFCERTMPDGAENCKFKMWKVREGEENRWHEYTNFINEKALQYIQRKQNG